MQPDDLTRIRHMFEAAENALHFIFGKSRPDLDTDPMLLFALVRAIEIIGEAASRVSAEQRAASPKLPWSAIVAMRNRLIHAYFDIDRDIVWRTVTEEIPSLRLQLLQLLPQDSTALQKR
jgi:uncharacterized protein with HEPN domain